MAVKNHKTRKSDGASSYAQYTPLDKSRAIVYEMTKRGESQISVAKELGVSVATVKRHFRPELQRARAEKQGVVVKPIPKDDPDAEEQAARDYVKAASVVGVKHTVMGQYLGISVQVLKSRYGDILAEGRSMLNAEAAGLLVQRMRAGDTGAIIFYLKSMAGWRERGDPAPVERPPVVINIVSATGQAPQRLVSR